MIRGVKSKKIRRTEGNKSCHDFHHRDAISSPETNVIYDFWWRVTILQKSWYDFRHRGAI